MQVMLYLILFSYFQLIAALMLIAICPQRHCIACQRIRALELSCPGHNTQPTAPDNSNVLLCCHAVP